MKVSYIIPSYKRAKLLCQTTLPLLDKHKVDEVSIYVEKDQLEEYQLELTYYRFNIRIHLIPVECTGIGNLRNLIRSSYGTGSNLLMIDDDIKDICIKKDEKLVSLENLTIFVINMFKKCEEDNIYLWSVQLHNNPYFMKKEYYNSLVYINGSFTGHRIDHSRKKIEVNMNHFEDYLFSIKHFIRDKSVLKAGNVCLKTKCFNSKGGICEQLGSLKIRKLEAERNSRILEDYFSTCMEISYSKKYNVDNVKLKHVKWRPEFVDYLDAYEYATPDFFPCIDEVEVVEELIIDDITEALSNWDVESNLHCPDDDCST